jgi:hypothetical protein
LDNSSLRELEGGLLGLKFGFLIVIHSKIPHPSNYLRESTAITSDNLLVYLGVQILIKVLRHWLWVIVKIQDQIKIDLLCNKTKMFSARYPCHNF